MKKNYIFLLLFCFVLCFTSCISPDSGSHNNSPPSDNENKFPSEQTENNTIYCDPISANQGQEISVPISIKNNNGFCGFEIIITYDENVVTPQSITPSALLSTGNFNNSLETTDDNSFSVVWSGTKNITDDAELFVINFVVDSNATENTEIKISYNKENTINDNIEEIVFNCQTISINLQSED